MWQQLLITFGSIIVTEFITLIVASKLHDQRLNNIEHKLDIHNGYAEKLGDVQRDISALKTDVEWIKQRWTK